MSASTRAKALLERWRSRCKQSQVADGSKEDVSSLLSPSWLPLVSTHVLPFLSAGEQAALRLTCRVARDLPISAVTSLRLRLSQHSAVLPDFPQQVYPGVTQVHIQELGRSCLRGEISPIGMKDQLAALLTGQLATAVTVASINLQYFSIRNAQEVVMGVLTLLPNITAIQVDNWNLPTLSCIPLLASSKLQSLIARPTSRVALEPQHSAAYNLDSLGKLTQLQLLSIARPYLNVEDNLMFLTALTNLTTLSLYEASRDYEQVPDTVKLQCLSGLSRLQNLSLTLRSTTSMQLSSITTLSRLSRLQLLDYAYCDVDPVLLDLTASLSCLSNLQSLTDLTVTYTALPTHAHVDVSVFGACSGLTHLGFSGAHVTGTITMDMFPHLVSLECYAEFNPHLSTLTQLQSLIWHDEYRWGYVDPMRTEGCDLLSGLSALTQLTRLVVHDSAERRWQDATRNRTKTAALPELLYLQNLQQLHLCLPSMGRATLANVAKLSALTRLELCTCWTQRQPPRVLVTGRDLLQLLGCQRLKQLAIRHMDCIPTVYVVALVKALQLQLVEVYKCCMVTREGARWLTRKCLEVSGGEVRYTPTPNTDTAIKRMGCMCFVCWYQCGEPPAVVRQSCMAVYRTRGLMQ